MIFWKSSKSETGPRKTTILTVDDSSTMLIVLGKLLSEMGYAVLQASNGLEGVQMAQAQTPDLIIMDVTMPGMNGIEALAKLKENPKTAAIPVMMCSSEQTGKDLDKAFHLGAVEYLIKPVTAERLKAKISKILPPAATA